MTFALLASPHPGSAIGVLATVGWWEWINSLPASLWAILGGVIGALSTHLFARYREGKAWVKQRIFDSVAELNAIRTELVSAVSMFYSTVKDEPRTVHAWMLTRKDSDITAMATLSRAYRVSLIQLRMLVPKGDKTFDELSTLVKAHEDYVWLSARPDKHFDPNDAIRKKTLNKPIQDAEKRFTSSHSSVVASMARKYWGLTVEPGFDDKTSSKSSD